MITGAQQGPRRLTGGVCILFAAIFVYVASQYAIAHWIPTGDDALTLQRVRSVWSAHPPLVGLPGRIGIAPHQGSHPGPLSFFALWPGYRVFGSTAWSLQAATLVVHLAAILTAMVLVYRRCRSGLVIGFAGAFAALVFLYGPLTMAQPWNPFLPTLWWVTFLVAVWAFECGDHVAAPVAVVAGSFCAATHISYAALVPGLLIVGVVVFVVRVRRGDVPWSRTMTVSISLAAVAALVLWLPPLVQQLRTSPGNLGIIVRYFVDPPSVSIGLSDGTSVLLVHLNPANLVTRRMASGSELPGLLVFVAWAVSAVVAVRRRITELVLLDVLLAAALVLAALSLARIFGPVFWYLSLWSYGLLVVLLLALAWTAVDVLRDHGSAGRVTVGLLGAVVIGALVWAGVGFAGDVRERPLPFGGADQVALRAVVPATAAALDRAATVARNHRVRATLGWVDPYRVGNAGFGLFAELSRSGYDVGVLPRYAHAFAASDLRPVARSDLRVQLVAGPAIAAWRAQPGAVEVATVDPRTRAQRGLFALARARGLAALRAAHLERLEHEFTHRTGSATVDPRMPPAVRDAALEMINLGDRVSVFVVPASGVLPEGDTDRGARPTAARRRTDPGLVTPPP